MNIQQATRKPGRLPGLLVQLLAIAVLATVARPAAATLQAIEQAYELTRSQVQLPSETGAWLRVHPCQRCPTVVLQVTAATQWFGAPGSAAISRKEMLDAFKEAALQPATLVYVYYEPRTKQVKRVVLDRRQQVRP